MRTPRLVQLDLGNCLQLEALDTSDCLALREVNLYLSADGMAVDSVPPAQGRVVGATASEFAARGVARTRLRDELLKQGIAVAARASRLITNKARMDTDLAAFGVG